MKHNSETTTESRGRNLTLRGAIFLVWSAFGLQPAIANERCGGNWGAFIEGVQVDAVAAGLDAELVSSVLSQLRQSQKVLAQDRSQKNFRQSFLKFSGRAVSSDRLRRGEQMKKRYASILNQAQQTYGVPAEVILAFWAMETDYGAFMGNVPTLNALATLAHDCRRPHLFRPQLLAGLELVARGDLSASETGAWAGEIGHVQMLPGDILAFGQDGDGDGRVRIKTSAPDAILSAANLLQSHGWRASEPWLVEVTTPETFDWGLSGLGKRKTVADWTRLGVQPRDGRIDGNLHADLVLPQGHKGPKFLAFSNFSDVYLEWNKSLVNTLTAAYLATRLGGANVLLKGSPDAGLNGDQMKRLQTKLQKRGHDVGDVDGILGAKTRAAVRQVQSELGMPSDGWPTPLLLGAL